jgi:magnesium-transporting ATPase (P-type)
MWKAFAEQFKECGRNGTLFVFALLGVMAGSLVTSAMGKSGVTALWAVWTILLVRGCVRFVRDWKNPSRLGRLPPLSQNDLRVARSKLMKYRNERSG